MTTTPPSTTTTGAPSEKKSVDTSASKQSLELGKLVRMRALKPSELPSHPDLAPQQSNGSPPSLQDFIASILEEAETFMTGYLSRNFKVKSKDKGSAPAAAPVELLSHEIKSEDLPKVASGDSTGGETWFARTSLHENKAIEGTASWEEFDAGLRQDHSVHEMEYTPDVQDAHKFLDWEGELDSIQHTVGQWQEVQVELREMCHHIPTPLNDRVFSVCVITAKHSSNNDQFKEDSKFLVVQIPVATKGMPGAKYNSKPKVTAGMYVSIERGELVKDGKEVKWQMATASDAGGVLPMWAQKMGVPGAVVKDVGLFIDWTAKRRQGKA